MHLHSRVHAHTYTCTCEHTLLCTVKYLKNGMNVQCNNERYDVEIISTNIIPIGRMHIF